MRTEGYVRKAKRNSATALVSVCRPESCVGCANAGLCEKKNVEILAVNKIGAEEGDTVTLETAESGLSIALISYIFLVPVALIFAAYFLYTVNPWLALTMIPVTATYFILLKYFERKFKPTAIITDIKTKKGLSE